MIRSWLRYLLLLAAALVFYIFYYGWFSWYALCLVLALPLLSLLVSLPAMFGLHVSWRWPERAECLRGAPVSLTLGRKQAHIPAPRCRITLRIQNLANGEQTALPLWLEERQAIPLSTEHCGVLHCQLTDGWVYDYLCLFRFPKSLPGAQSLSIWPEPLPPEPLPQLSQLEARRWIPKPGGGFAEQHELRPYRPGDPLHAIHWKLSAKADDLILREPQEPVRSKLLLSFDFVSPSEHIDATLSELRWLTDWLLEHELPHEVRYLATDGSPCCVPIRSESDARQLLAMLLRSRWSDALPSLRDRTFPADWRYHIP